MKFTVQRDAIQQATAAVQRATATRIIQPILANILLEISKETQTLKLSATDLDFAIETTLPAQVQEGGRITMSAKKLAEIFAKLPPGQEVSFEIETSAGLAHIQCGAAQFDIRTLSADEYPLIPQAGAASALQVHLKSLVRAIHQTAFAAAGYESNNVLGGVYFKLTAESLELVATDGSRLARRIEALSSGNVTEPISAIIPARALQEFVRLIGIHPGEDETVRLAIQDGQIFFTTPQYHVVSRLLDGQYPKYEQLIPLENHISATANRADLIASLERAAVMANERTNIVKMYFDGNKLSLAANTPDVGDSKDMLPVRFDGGEPLNIAFNYKYVLDALKVIESDDVRMETNGALAPTLFKSSGEENGRYVCLVMPVQVK